MVHPFPGERFPSDLQARGELRPFLGLFARVVADGVAHANRACAAFAKDDPGPLFSGHVRHYVKTELKRRLREGGLAHVLGIEEGPDEEFSLDDGANLAVWLVVGRYRIRVLKLDEGQGPRPGNPSQVRFMTQRAEATLFDPEGLTNLVVAWSVDARRSLTEIRVILPLGWEDGEFLSEWEFALGSEEPPLVWSVEDGTGSLFPIEELRLLAA